MENLRPEDEAQLRDVVAEAASADTPLALTGGGSKAGYGAPVEAQIRISTSAITGIVSYEPGELVLTAGAGTPLSEIYAALEAANQGLAFEPPDWRGLLGNGETTPTIGGTIAANMSGPGRLRAGAARDHLLGARLITGRGEIVKTGGKVVKNVTGYDLCKLLAGSFGTFGIMTEVTVKTLPAPEKLRTVLLVGVEGDEAIQIMTKILGTPQDVSAAACLPAEIASRSTVGYVNTAGTSVTAFRIDGPEPSVLARCDQLRDLLAPYGAVEELHFHNSRKLWSEIGDVSYFAAETAPVWRISVPPASGARVAAAIQDRMEVEGFHDWGGGLIWLMVPDDREDGGAGVIRGAIEGCGGHATLIRGNEALRGHVAVFQPPRDGVARLSERIRQGFDPEGIFNRGILNGAVG